MLEEIVQEKSVDFQQSFFVPEKDQQAEAIHQVVVKEAIRLLPNRPLWKKERPKGYVLISDWWSDLKTVATISQPSGERQRWSFWQDSDVADVAVLGVAVPRIDRETRDDVFLFLSQKMGLLKSHDSLVFVLEPKNGPVLEEPRVSLLEDLGLVRPNVFKNIDDKDSGAILLEGRLRKKQERRQPVNLLANRQKIGWYQWLWREMSMAYRLAGYRVVEARDSEVIKRLRKSRYPLGDIETLRSGYGVTIEAGCGCRWQIDMRGMPHPHGSCGGGCRESERGEPSFEFEGFEKVYLQQNRELDTVCFGRCGGNKWRETYTIVKKNANMTLILFNQGCSSCGDPNQFRKWVWNSQIVKLDNEIIGESSG